ncbi:MAG: GNAT family N-acetyltransferase [Lachnospiraceae bacterium]|nr:GNAT family N-acetyltransferase [Lachnospiraceae bacterium]
MTDFTLKKRQDWTKSETTRVNKFIMDKSTNGEFIHAPFFLEYHPKNRFTDDSVAIFDLNCGTVAGVMMAAVDPNNKRCVISHPGTTFAGPVVKNGASISLKERIVSMLLNYYESIYSKICIKTVPEIYTTQCYGEISYFLLKRGYNIGMTALANVANISKYHSEDEVFELYKGKRRNHIRKAIALNNFKLESNKTIRKDVWDHMTDNLCKKFHSRPTHSYSEVCSLVERCPEYIKAYYANSKDGDYGAFALIFQFKNVFHTQYLDTNYAYAGQYPNLFLIHHLFLEAIKTGCTFFSFGSSTENGGNYLNQGLHNYKAEYGGGSIILPIYQKDL